MIACSKFRVYFEPTHGQPTSDQDSPTSNSYTGCFGSDLRASLTPGNCSSISSRVVFFVFTRLSRDALGDAPGEPTDPRLSRDAPGHPNPLALYSFRVTFEDEPSRSRLGRGSEELKIRVAGVVGREGAMHRACSTSNVTLLRVCTHSTAHAALK